MYSDNQVESSYKFSLPEKSRLQRQIDDATDRLIDQLVYALYELTEEDVRLVEEATGGPDQ